MNEPNPFLVPARQSELYGHASRLAGRTSALLRAKTAGHPVPETIVSLVQTHHARPDRLGVVLDIGCGRGSSSLVIAEQLQPESVVGLDAAPSLLAQARQRAEALPDSTVDFVEGDFHDIPLPDGSSDVVVAAFCLYHSTRPEDVIAQIARVLAPGGLAVLVTKGLDSYQEMDQLVASAGLDPRAAQHESLYTAAHSGNLADLTAPSLDVIAVMDEEHTFTFDGHDHTAQYLATNPKYDLAPGLYGNPGALAATLHEFLPDQPLTTRSRITFVIAQPK
ncbi:2-methoxy-6-polyprenyl-1,4-benzoquinol methylase, mitochondrial [Streptomyces sp. enrichment culture]|uniref:class I SAM-dependent methyltransferase n=1 Tax=Streptomyces sp. enrichment culture TaxID=1795815 RepID=UPI003F562325